MSAFPLFDRGWPLRSAWLRRSLVTPLRRTACLLQWLLEQPLDRPEVATLFRSTERNRGAPASHPSRAANAVNIGLRVWRQVIIDDVGNVVHIQATGGNKRKAGAEELAQQYQQQLQRDDSVAWQALGKISHGYQVPGTFRNAGGQAGEAAVASLFDLAVDFPLRGRVFHFTTPRGEVTVTARSVSSEFLTQLTRLGIALLGVVGLVLIYKFLTRVDLAELLGTPGAVLLIALGAGCVLTGILPVVGGMAIVVGSVVLKKTRRARMTVGA